MEWTDPLLSVLEGKVGIAFNSHTTDAEFIQKGNKPFCSGFMTGKMSFGLPAFLQKAFRMASNDFTLPGKK